MLFTRALRQMWREQFDVFWDGQRRFALGWFDGVERAPAASARPELIVVSALDEHFAISATLVDVIDASRWRARVAVFDAPPDHRFIRILAADGAEMRVALSAERDLPSGGEWRLLMTQLPDAGGVDPVTLRLASLAARGDVERMAREQASTAGARLVWAVGQRRVLERLEGDVLLVRIGPARRMFPAHQSRLVLAATPLTTEAAADTREPPFAIMTHWLHEGGAPRVILNLRIPDSLEESAALLGRCCVVLAMNQRRRLKNWMLDQKAAGEPGVDPLTFEDIRQATGEPGEHPDAVETNDAIIVVNLLALIMDADDTDVDGVALRRAREKTAPGMGETVEIEFYGAALGDDVGVVCPTAQPGDLGIAPVDPGGAAFARLFRVEGDGLVPRRPGDDDGLLDELMRRATDAARATTGAAARAVAERAAGLHSRREKLVASLNGALSRAEMTVRFETSGLWDALEPLLQTSFVALASESPAPARARLQQLGGYGAYRVDPALTAALARGGDFAQSARPPQGAARMSLLARYLDSCGVAGMAPEDLTAAAQARLMRALMQESDLAALSAARIGLGLEASTRRAAMQAAQILQDGDLVERALSHFIANGEPDSAAALQAYLVRRREAQWTPPQEAPALVALVARAGVESDTAPAQLASEAPPPEKPKGFFRRIFGV